MAGKGSGAAAALALAAVIWASLAASASARLTVSWQGRRHEQMSIRARPGGHDDLLRVDLAPSKKALVIRGDIAGPYPASCSPLEAPERIARLRCPVELALLKVRTGGGDDRIELGAHARNARDRRAFHRRLFIANVDAGTGDDVVNTAATFSEVRLGAGDDSAEAKGGEEDRLLGGPGDDRIVGGPTRRDTLLGGAGADVLRTGAGGGYADGEGGRDMILGGGGDDFLQGRSGNDRIGGSGGFDLLDGGSGADHLLGGGGFDLISGGFGNDTILDGPGPGLVDAGRGRHDRCIVGPDTRFEGCERF